MKLLLTLALLFPLSAHAAGTFTVSNGKIIAPSGKPFVPLGISLADSQMATASTSASGAPLTTAFPGINFVRVSVYSYNAPSYYAAFINQMTALGIVVSFGDYRNSTGSNSGGGIGTIFTGTLLTNEINWYTAMAKAYVGNPYVWFSTNNEPPKSPSLAALSTWHQQTYNAIRGAGNNSIILIDEYGGGVSGDMGPKSGLTASVYAAMSNIAWDVHQYGWESNYSTNQATVTAALASMTAEAQSMPTASGTAPVVIGEYGNSTTGASIDAGANEVIYAVGHSGFGSAAWEWRSGAVGDNLTNGNNTLTAYGSQVAAIIGTASPPPPPPPPPPPSTFTPSPNDTQVQNGSGGVIIDTTGGKWTLSVGVVYLNGALAGYSANVTRIVIVGGVIWQENTSNAWYDWLPASSSWGPAGGTAVSPLPVSCP